MKKAFWTPEKKYNRWKIEKSVNEEWNQVFPVTRDMIQKKVQVVWSLNVDENNYEVGFGWCKSHVAEN